jgi:hypothetical protein
VKQLLIFVSMLMIVPLHAAELTIVPDEPLFPTVTTKATPLQAQVKPHGSVTADITTGWQRQQAVIIHNETRALPKAAELTHPDDPVGTGTIATSVQALVQGCAAPHYLLALHPDGSPAFNRFQWWDKHAPRTGPIRMNGATDITFECEFFPGLTTVVGADTNIGTGLQNLLRTGYKVIAWDMRDQNNQFVYNSFADIPQLEFAMRTSRPTSEPKWEDITLPFSGSKRLLVNRTSADHELESGRFRPALWIDFVRPQRAVGIEYGYLELPGRQGNIIRAADVRLIAYDADGTVITESTGDELDVGSSRLLAVDVNNRIGVRDEDGGIMSVELRFEEEDPEEPGNPILEPQVVYRIWHEPLPPAAVLQTAVAIGAPPSVPDAYPPIPLGPVTHRLPFNLDRAIVLLRGFKLDFTDQKAHKVSRIGVGFNGQTLFKTLPGGAITIDPDAFMLPAADNSGLDNNAVIYYTVLAWEDNQTELYTAAIGDYVEDANDTSASGLLSTRDPCPVAVLSTSPDPEQYRADAEERCGQIFAALSRFELASSWAWNDQVYDRLTFEAGDYAWAELGWALGPNASLLHDDRRIDWGVSGIMEGDGKPGLYVEVEANILTGRSLTVGPDPHANVDAVRNSYPPPVPLSWPANLGQRPPLGSVGHWLYTWDVWRQSGLSWPVFADVAAVGLRRFDFMPEDELDTLEVEVEGAHYDGEIVDWQVGLGIWSGPPIQGGALGSGHYALGWPQFAAVKRKAAFAAPRLKTIGNFECAGVVGLGAQGCNNTVVIRNTGDGQALITQVAPGIDPQDARFRYSFIWRGERLYDLASLGARLPLQLRPGEQLLVGAWYEPEPWPDGRETFLDIGFLNFRTANPVVHASLWANGRGRMPAAAGEWRPNALTFEALSVGGSSAQIATLVTTGQTTLVINWQGPNGGLYFADPTLGFTVTPAPQQPESEALLVVVDYVPQTGTYYNAATTLYADTNAGLIALPVRATLNGG